MIQFNNIRISLDRKEANSDLDFVSHAHSDHVAAVKSSKGVLASPQTMQLIEETHSITIQNKAENENLKMVEAGHMLGSKQLYVDDLAMGMRITYTGDFQTAKSRTAKSIEIVDTDVLIMDSTYPEPSVDFGNKHDVETAIQDWTTMMLKQGIVVFSTYAMGKAQELIALLNEVGIRPVVNSNISRASRVYVKNGVNLDYTSAYDDNSDYEEVIRDNFVGVTTNRNLSTLKSELEKVHKKKVNTAVTTGFAKRFRFNTDAQFPLSDHADFKQSIEYIEATKTKRVLTYGPNAITFAENLKKEGCNAAPFSNEAIYALQTC
jgi:Cft2 family RNA processing exonuclease